MGSIEEWSDFFLKAGFDETAARTFAKKFIEEEICTEILETISEEDLKQLGIETIGDRRGILLHIQKTTNITAAEAEVVKSNEDTTPGTIDFTFIISTNHTEVLDSLDLTGQNKHLRRNLYVAWTNAVNTRLIYENVKKQMLEFSKIFSLQFNSEEDVLYALLKCDNTKRNENPTCVSTKIRILSYPFFVQSIIKPTESKRTCLASDVIQFGRPHIYSHPCNESDSTSSADDIIDDTGKPERRKPCSLTNFIDYGGEYAIHKDNMSYFTGTIARVDVLIIFPDSNIEMIRTLANYLGFISVEDVIDEMARENPNPKENEYNDLLNLLKDENSRVYRPLHQYIIRKIMFGYNNVCLTCNMSLFHHIHANVKASIFDKNVAHLGSTSVVAKNYSNFTLTVNSNCIFQYISALAEILDAAMNGQGHIVLNVNDKGSGKEYQLNFPMASIVPLHVLRILSEKMHCNPDNKVHLL